MYRRLMVLTMAMSAGVMSASGRAQETVAQGPMVPAGVKWDLRLQTPLDSSMIKVDQRFEGFTVLDYSSGGQVIVPAVSQVRGFIGSVQTATTGRTDKSDRRGGAITLAFDELKIGERSFRLRASVEQVFRGQPNSETTARDGSDPAIGAAMSRLPGGGQGPVIGVIVGPGGTIASTEGADVKLPLGTILRIRIDRPIEIGGPAAR